MLEKSSYYPGQQSKEEIVLFIRQHKFAYVKWSIILLSLLILPPLAFFVAVDIGIIELNNDNYDYFILLASAYLLFLMALFLTTWIEYYLNVAILTRTHLIHIRQNELFTRSVSEQSLLRVQDVSSTIKGFFSNLLKFGNVYVETAGEEPNFILTNVANPNAVAKVIMEIHEELVTEIQTSMEIADGVGEFYSAKVKQKKREIDLDKSKVISIQEPQKTIFNTLSTKTETPKQNISKTTTTIKKIENVTHQALNADKIITVKKPIVLNKKRDISKPALTQVQPQQLVVSSKHPQISSFELSDNEVHNKIKEDIEGELREGEEIKF